LDRNNEWIAIIAIDKVENAAAHDRSMATLSVNP